MKTVLMDIVKKMPSQIHSAREAAAATEDKCAAEVKGQEALAMKLDDYRVQYDVLSRDVETDQATYDGILTRLKDAKVTTGSDSTNVHIFEPALLPGAPMQLKKSLILGAGLAIGVLVGLLLSLVLHRMDSSVKTVDQAEDLLGLTVLASIPRQSPSRLKDSSLALIKAPSSPVAEAFRSLRTSIFLAGRAQGRKMRALHEYPRRRGEDLLLDQLCHGTCPTGLDHAADRRRPALADGPQVIDA